MTEQMYFGLKKIANRLGLGEALTRRLCQKGIVIAHQSKTQGKKKVWYCNESEAIETIRERLPGNI